MKSAVIHSICLLVLIPAIFSCKKKKKEEVPFMPTDSLYMFARVNAMTFTASTSEALFSPNGAYITIKARTGPDTLDESIILQIDDFANRPGTYSLAPGGRARAYYGYRDSEVEVADSGQITIDSLGQAIRGTFYFYTEKYRVTGGVFNVQ
jgi:hypothetical protein